MRGDLRSKLSKTQGPVDYFPVGTRNEALPAQFQVSAATPSLSRINRPPPPNSTSIALCRTFSSCSGTSKWLYPNTRWVCNAFNPVLALPRGRVSLSCVVHIIDCGPCRTMRTPAYLGQSGLPPRQVFSLRVPTNTSSISRIACFANRTLRTSYCVCPGSQRDQLVTPPASLSVSSESEGSVSGLVKRS